MFTGLIHAVRAVRSVHNSGSGMDLAVDLGSGAQAPAAGDSIALSGVCCTVTRLERTCAHFQLSTETLRKTWFRDLAVGMELNIEKALRAGDPLGGHLVQGHVDGVGEVLEPVGAAGGEWWVRVPGELLPYCASKGSIALEGVSLTIAALQGDRIMLAIVPHTAAHTTVGRLQRGRPVNVEVDVLAKYVERLLDARLPRQ